MRNDSEFYEMNGKSEREILSRCKLHDCLADAYGFDIPTFNAILLSLRRTEKKVAEELERQVLDGLRENSEIARIDRMTYVNHKIS